MIDFVSPFGRPKDRLDANEKRDRKRKLHYVTLFSETEKTSQTSHTNLRPTSDFFASDRLDLGRRWVSHWGAFKWALLKKPQSWGRFHDSRFRFWPGHVRWYWLPYKEFQCRFRNDWHDDIRPPRSAFLRRMIKLINGWKFLWTNIFIMMQNKLYIIVKYCEVRGFGKSCCQSPERIRAVRAICQIHLL